MRSSLDCKGINLWLHFLQDWLGPSWRTSLWGILILVLSGPAFVLGAVLTRWEHTQQAGLALLAQAGLMVVSGVGFLLTRDHRASELAHQESLRKIEAGQAAHEANVAKLAALDATVRGEHRE